MAGEYLLDSTIIIGLFRRDARILQRLRSAPSVEIPAIALGDLYLGVHRALHSEHEQQKLEQFLIGRHILPCDIGTAQVYGQVKAGLLRKGRPIPDNDMWIASIAIQHRLTLVARDAHFREVDAIELEEW